VTVGNSKDNDQPQTNQPNSQAGTYLPKLVENYLP